MNGNPTKKQSDFHKWCREDIGCVVSGMDCDSIHHIKGAKMKLKGVKGAGEWFIIPLSYFWHQDGTNPAAIHVNKSRFVQANDMTEKDYWLDLMVEYKAEKGEYPMSDDEYQIMVERA